MVEITLKVDRGRLDELELDTLIAMDEGRLSARALRDLLVTYAVDEDGEYLPREEALRRIGRARVTEIREIMERFVAQLQEAAVPPTNGGE